MYTAPTQDILKGLVGLLGMEYPAGDPPVGVLNVYGRSGGNPIETSVINNWSYGPWQMFAEHPDKYLPFVHIEEEDLEEYQDGPFGKIEPSILYVYYVCGKVTDSPLATNPYIVAKMRATALRNLAESDWAMLGSPIKVNAVIGKPTLRNDWQEWNHSNNTNRIAYVFPIEISPRRVAPELGVP